VTCAIGHGTFHVIGILKTANGFEDGGVFMPLSAAQTSFTRKALPPSSPSSCANKDRRDASFKAHGQGEVPKPDRA
jgi:putative ABC transport system permease protein